MAANRSGGKRVVCVRCKQELPEGVTYCAGCGIANDDIWARKLDIDNRLNSRAEHRSALRRIFSMINGIFRIFR